MGSNRRFKRGGFSLEYAIMVSVTAAAFTGVGLIVGRALQARVNAGNQAYTSVGAGETIATLPADAAKDPFNTGALDIKFEKGTQYEGYATEQNYQTYTERLNQTHMGNGEVNQEKVSDLTARAAFDGNSGYTTQRGARQGAYNRQRESDKMWQE